MTEILLFTTSLVLKCGSMKCQSYLFHSQSWQEACTLLAPSMSLTILQSIMF